MRYKVVRFRLIVAGVLGLFLFLMGFLQNQIALAQGINFQPRNQEPDLSNAILRLSDLPPGFQPLTGRDLDAMESAVGSIGAQLSGATGASLINFTGFRTTDARNPHIVVSGLISPLSSPMQSQMNRAFADPQALIEELRDQIGGDETSELPGYESIGDIGLGFVTNMMGFRMEYVVARRGPVLIEVAYLYREGERPIADTIELARILDDRVADVVGRETGTSFRPAGPYVPNLTTYIPTPLDISTRPGVLGTNLFLAALLMLPFVVAAELFTRTLGEHENALQRFRPIGWLVRLQQRLGEMVDGRPVERSSRQDALKLVGVIIFYGLVFSLLDRTWNPFSLQGLILFLSMTIAYGVVGIADDIIQWRTIRKWGLSADLSIRSSNFVLAVVSTGTSRLLSLVPGLMFGTPEALRTEEGQFDEPSRSSLLKISVKTFIFIGLGVWLFTAITTVLQRLPLAESTINLIGGLEGFLLVVFAVALENLFVQMLGFPGGFGQALKRRNKWGWLAALTGVTFLFYHTLINPRGELAEALEKANVWLFFGIAIAFVIFAFGLHYSLHRPKQESPKEALTPTPALTTERIVAATPAAYAPSAPAPVEAEAKTIIIPMNEAKQCPVCCNPIKAEARICRYCKATFTITVRGYCLTDHEVVEANADGKCVHCGSDLTDPIVESRLLKAPAVPPVETPAPPPEPEAKADTKVCPACRQTIKAEARLCRYCKATFTVKILGYCTTDHAVVEATVEGKCVQCGSEVKDLHVVSSLLKAPAVAPVGTTDSAIPPVPTQTKPDTKGDTKTCPACGQTIKAEAKICRFCHARLEVAPVVQSKPAPLTGPQPTAPHPSTERVNRPGCVTAYAILLILGAGLFTLVGLSGGSGYTELGPGAGGIITLVALVSAAVSVLIAVGLWQLKSWARILVLIVTGLGTASSVLTLVSVFLAPAGNVSPYLQSSYYTGIALSLITGLIGLGINSTIFGWFRKNKQYFVQESSTAPQTVHVPTPPSAPKSQPQSGLRGELLKKIEAYAEAMHFLATCGTFNEQKFAKLDSILERAGAGFGPAKRREMLAEAAFILPTRSTGGVAELHVQLQDALAQGFQMFNEILAKSSPTPDTAREVMRILDKYKIKA